MRLLVINGVNLNLLGTREPGIYGNFTLDDVSSEIMKKCDLYGYEVEMFQSNYEGEIVEKIHSARDKNVDYIIINPGAFTHYSVAIRDAISGVGIPAIEVHISNVYKREEFRHKSVTAPVCIGQITGFSWQGYIMAIEYIKTVSGK